MCTVAVADGSNSRARPALTPAGERGSGCLALPVLCDHSVPRTGRPELCAAQPFALPGIFGSALFALQLVLQCVRGVCMELGWPVSS